MRRIISKPGDAMTERQAAIVAYMREHLVEHQRPPTLREIGQRFGIKSPNGVMAHIAALVGKGRLLCSRRGERHLHYRLAGVRVVIEDLEGQG